MYGCAKPLRVDPRYCGRGVVHPMIFRSTIAAKTRRAPLARSPPYLSLSHSPAPLSLSLLLPLSRFNCLSLFHLQFFATVLVYSLLLSIRLCFSFLVCSPSIQLYYPSHALALSLFVCPFPVCEPFSRSRCSFLFPAYFILFLFCVCSFRPCLAHGSKKPSRWWHPCPSRYMRTWRTSTATPSRLFSTLYSWSTRTR